MDIEGILRDVPDYKSFKTVDELKASSKELCQEYPDIVEKKIIGQSRKGEEIEALKIGEGSRTVLLFACPHPNEPIGSMMLDYLSERLGSDQELRQKMDTTWYIIKCIDPDGTRLNEGWFKGPFTPENYARHFYRPASFEQAEWTFPVEYKTLKFKNPIPETRALMKIIEEAKPDFMYSLHNAGFGGVYYYISEPCPEIYKPFRKLATERNLPLNLGEPEMPYAVKYSDAIYQLPSTADTYDYLEENIEGDPAEVISGGTSSFDYLQQFNSDSFSLVCEMPYFYDSRIEDLSQSNLSRKEAVLESANLQEQVFNFIRDSLNENNDILTNSSPFKTAVTEFVRTAESNIAAKRSWAENNQKLEKWATKAQEFDNLVITRFYTLLVLGMVIRLYKAELKKQKDKTEHQIKRLKKEQERVEEFFDKWAQNLENDLDYDVIPIKKLVEVQLGSALNVLNLLD